MRPVQEGLDLRARVVSLLESHSQDFLDAPAGKYESSPTRHDGDPQTSFEVGRRLVDSVAGDGEERSLFDELVGERASGARAHVFTLLGLILPAEPLRDAYRGLHSTDKTIRGAALEYLKSVLPPEIRVRLWPFLEG